jgi:hypothetical protein
MQNSMQSPVQVSIFLEKWTIVLQTLDFLYQQLLDIQRIRMIVCWITVAVQLINF